MFINVRIYESAEIVHEVNLLFVNVRQSFRSRQKNINYESPEKNYCLSLWSTYFFTTEAWMKSLTITAALQYAHSLLWELRELQQISTCERYSTLWNLLKRLLFPLKISGLGYRFQYILCYRLRLLISQPLLFRLLRYVYHLNFEVPVFKIVWFL